MKKQFLFLTSAIILFGISLVSASLCKDSYGYYQDCNDEPLFDHRYQGPSDRSSASYYNYDYNPPIFKGSYGNYRYQMYAHGDYKPTLFFRDYPDYYSYYSYPSYGPSFYRSPHNNYGYDYSYSYPFYSIPYFSFWF